MAEYEYTLSIFLMHKASAERLVPAILAAGYAISPGLTGRNTFYTGDASTLMCVTLTHTESKRDVVYDKLIAIIKEKEVPCYGFAIHSGGGSKFYAGYLPEVKKLKTVEQGPYRTPSLPGDVIPFPKKDDGQLLDE